jgi:hypothetical protein
MRPYVVLNHTCLVDVPAARGSHVPDACCCPSLSQQLEQVVCGPIAVNQQAQPELQPQISSLDSR